MSDDHWRLIKGFYVSRDGQVKDQNGNEVNTFQNKGFLAMFAPLSSDKEYYYIHQLVAEAFL